MAIKLFWNILKKIKKWGIIFWEHFSPKLWFVNIGEYDPGSIQEKHEFGLVLALSKLKAINKAKFKLLGGFKKG